MSQIDVYWHESMPHIQGWVNARWLDYIKLCDDLSTSGHSPNVVAALAAAREEGLATLAFCGADPGPMAAYADLVLAAPSRQNTYIQQIHITAAHGVCGLVERAMFPQRAT